MRLQRVSLHHRLLSLRLCCAGANAMAMSLAAGRRVTLSKVDAFADGVAVKEVGWQVTHPWISAMYIVGHSSVLWQTIVTRNFSRVV